MVVITARARIALAIAFVLIGGALLWIGYAQDQQRDRYYDCRQSAMDNLHINLTTHLDETDDPEVWVPNWREDFHDWHDMLMMCDKP